MSRPPLYSSSRSSPQAFAVTPSDTVNYSQGVSRYVFAAGAGTVALVTLDGTVVTYTVPAGTYIWAASLRVNATGTTSTGIVGHV
jgi:hypothetical protein